MIKSGTLHKVRYESFGGIVSFSNPPFIAWVDQDYMKRIGYYKSDLWAQKKSDSQYLSAPTEVHFSITNRCGQNCNGCYMGSSSFDNDDLSTKQLKKKISSLASMGVFQIALGGGEAFEREDLEEIIDHSNFSGIIPNLTTSGYKMGEREINLCKKMGQVNISIDGINSHYNCNERKGSFCDAQNAIEKLIEAGVNTGINCVVSKKNFHHLKKLVSFASKLGVNEIEFLKFKPLGRGKEDYETYKMTQQMIKSFYPLIMTLAEKFKIELKIDCSFVPSLIFHRPPIEELEKLAISGCDAGNLLLSVKNDGSFSGCSFVDNIEKLENVEEQWHRSEQLNQFRDLTKKITEPCKSCEYLSLCKGGCRAVALFYKDDFWGPDPECPKVFRYNKEHITWM